MKKMKVWKVGKADEKWKVYICLRDMISADNHINFVEYVTGHKIETLTGEEIKQAMLKYKKVAEDSIEAGKDDLKKKESDCLQSD